MKNKKSTYILLPLVLLIWGALIYKIVNFSNIEEIEVKQDNFTVKPLEFKEKDSIIIDINPRDPFSGKMVYDGKVKSSPASKSSKKATPKEPILWPQIKYKGIVSDNKDKIRVFMLIIDGKTFLLKQGAVEMEVTVLQGSRDKIELKYKTEKKEFLIQ